MLCTWWCHKILKFIHNVDAKAETAYWFHIRAKYTKIYKHTNSSINIQTHTQNLEHDPISRYSEGSKTVYVLDDKISWFQSILRVLLRVWEQ